jgi:dolichol-phosphate mannosyltransferase
MMQLSVLIPTLNERDDISRLIPALKEVIPPDVTDYEILVIDGHSEDGTPQLASRLGARVIDQTKPGYGGALEAGFAHAVGDYILTLDADLSHPPKCVPAMWKARHKAEVVIASRYVQGGTANMPHTRRLLSRILNLLFVRGMSLPIHDISSGFRLYKSSVVRSLSLSGTDFDVLEEILIRSHANGWQIIEVPFHYQSRRGGRSHARLFPVGWAFLKTFVRMWKLRNSIDSADYDYRAFDSPIPLQRYWQRKRHQIVTRFAQGAKRTLDIGCGSSRILPDLNEAVGLDIQINKIRFMRRYGNRGIVGSCFALPFADGAFDCVISSQVIEHLPADPILFSEMHRVLQQGGRLIVGTPDYGGFMWPAIEFFYARLAPGGYADEHITHYTQESLRQILKTHGFRPQAIQWVGKGEMILSCVKTTPDR